MSVEKHFETLTQKHELLEAAIQQAYSRHLSDEAISEMKKQKLHLKEEIYTLNQKMRQDNVPRHKRAA
jgi:hypothetical protein